MTNSVRAIGFVALLFAAGNVATGKTADQSATSQGAKVAHPEDRHLDMDLVVASHEQCDIASGALPDLQRAISAARKAETLDAAKAALDATQRPLHELEQHLGSCGDALTMLLTSPGHPIAERPRSEKTTSGQSTPATPTTPSRP